MMGLQAEYFIEERVWALLDPQRRIMANRVVENRFFPFSGNVGGGTGVGYVRDYGGTGVFLPRIPTNISSTSSADPMDDHPRRDRVRNKLTRFDQFKVLICNGLTFFSLVFLAENALAFFFTSHSK